MADSQRKAKTPKPAVKCGKCGVMVKDVKKHLPKCPATKPAQAPKKKATPKAAMPLAVKKSSLEEAFRNRLINWRAGELIFNPEERHQNVSTSVGVMTYSNPTTIPMDMLIQAMPGFSTPMMICRSTPGSTHTLTYEDCYLPIINPPTAELNLPADWARNYIQATTSGLASEVVTACNQSNIDLWTPLATRIKVRVSTPLTQQTGFWYAYTKPINPRKGLIPYNVAGGTAYTAASIPYSNGSYGLQIAGKKTSIQTLAMKQGATGAVVNGTEVELNIYPENLTDYSYDVSYSPAATAATAAVTLGGVANAAASGLGASPAGTYPAGTTFAAGRVATAGVVGFILQDTNSRNTDLGIPGSTIPPSWDQQRKGGTYYFTPLNLLGNKKTGAIFLQGLAPGSTVQVTYERLDSCQCQPNTPEMGWEQTYTGAKFDTDEIFPADFVKANNKKTTLRTV